MKKNIYAMLIAAVTAENRGKIRRRVGVAGM